MPGIIGKKIGMTSVFSAEGKNLPCTVIEAGPCVVTQIRTVEKDGYAAVQLAYDEISEKHASKPLKGHFEKAGTTPKRKLVEFKADFPMELKLGDTITLLSKAEFETFMVNQTVNPDNPESVNMTLKIDFNVFGTQWLSSVFGWHRR